MDLGSLDLAHALHQLQQAVQGPAQERQGCFPDHEHSLAEDPPYPLKGSGVPGFALLHAQLSEGFEGACGQKIQFADACVVTGGKE